MPRQKTRRQLYKSSEAQMSSLRPRQAVPQSVACFPALKLGANLRLSESQVMPSRSTAYRLSSVDGQLSAVSPEERSRLKTRFISAYSQMSVPMIETLPLAKAEEAYKRMMDGKARFRVVLTMT